MSLNFADAMELDGIVGLSYRENPTYMNNFIHTLASSGQISKQVFGFWAGVSETSAASLMLGDYDNSLIK